MSAIDAYRVTEQARQATRAALSGKLKIRLLISATADETYVATSPDAEWLMVTARSREAARFQAMAAILKVGAWCGIDLRWASDA